MKSRSMAPRLVSSEQCVTYGRYFTTFLLVTLVGCSDDPGQRQASGAAGNASGAAAGNAGTNSGGDAAGSRDSGASGGSQAMGGATSVGGSSEPAVPEPNPPGSACSCDSECAGDTSHPGVCVFGVCMTQATGSCEGGSTAECGPGARCWPLRGQSGTYLCWPDCAHFACEGVCDDDGACAYSANGTCDPTCGTHCPPEAAPCSPDNPMGFCGAGQECVVGLCTTPCSSANPTGYCPSGRTCEGGTCTNTAGCPDWKCTGSDCSDIVLMPGSQDPHSSQALADGYFINHELRYSYLRRDLTLLMAWAACEVKKRFPDQSPLGLGDLSQADGMTPGTDVGHLRHGSTTHRGNDLDVAYYQTDGLNNTQIICGDGTDTNGNSCCGTYNDGKFCTTQQNIVDWPPEAFLFAKMAVSPDTRVFGLDQTLVDAMRLHLDKLVASGDITQAERDHVNLGYGAAGGWQYHHHHSHFSYCRIGGCPRAFIIGGGDFMETMTSPWFDAGQWKGGMAPPPQQPNVLEPLLDGALEVPGVADEKGFYMEPRPSWNASE